MAEKESEKNVKVFRTDRGGEFGSNEFKEYCEGAGIERHYTTPYTPQQNGVVERRNRTVVEMARSSMKEMNLPAKFWGEAVRNAVYILNRVATRALTGQTPFEAWYESKPDVSHLRVFGCLAHMKIPANQLTKLDDRSTTAVNLGREPGTKGYRLYDPLGKRICISRDVVFEETKPWIWDEEEGGETVQIQFPDMEFVDSSNGSVDDEMDTGRGDTSDGELDTPLSQPSNTRVNRDDYDDRHTPKKFRSLNEVYDETEEVTLDEELYLMGVEEPSNFKQAAKDINWKKAMRQELDAIEANKTWELVTLPPGHKTIGVKWIFKLKKDAEGRIVKHKARLVAKGYAQEYGVDFDEVYAPVTRLETVRLLLALAAKLEWEVHHLDVKTAFLKGDLKEEVYVSQPEGFEISGQEHMVYRLWKALYGLRQAPRAWYAKLNASLESLGFSTSPSEHAVYTKREGKESIIVAVYVDDLLVTCSKVSMIEEFKKK